MTLLPLEQIKRGVLKYADVKSSWRKARWEDIGQPQAGQKEVKPAPVRVPHSPALPPPTWPINLSFFAVFDCSSVGRAWWLAPGRRPFQLRWAATYKHHLLSSLLLPHWQVYSQPWHCHLHNQPQLKTWNISTNTQKTQILNRSFRISVKVSCWYILIIDELRL